MRRLMMTVIALLVAAPAWAQEELNVSKIFLGDTPCVIQGGSGAPSSALGCDLWIRVDGNQAIWGGDLIGQTSVGSVSTSPILGWWETDASANNQAWDTVVDGEALRFRLVNDAYDASSTWLQVERTANTADTATFNVADILPAVGYATDLGSLAQKYLTLHAAELWVETLVAHDTMATIGGRVLVGPTTTLTSDLASGATSIEVKHNQIANGDRLVLQANLKVEFLAVTSGPTGSGPYTYTVTRNLDGSGANDWYAGDAVFNTGTTGDGYIDLYSVNGLIPGSTAGPTIVGNVRTGTTYNQVAPRWAIGNLNGLYGYGADTYGAAFGDASAAWAKIDATNGVRLGHNTTTNVSIDASGNAAFGGSIVAGGVIRSSGATALDTGTGYWLDASGTPVFRVGNPSGNRLRWDGTNLKIVSQSLTMDESGLRFSVPSGFSDTTSYRWAVTDGFLGTKAQFNTNQYDLMLQGYYDGATTSTVLNTSLASLYDASSGGNQAIAAVTATAYADFAEVAITAAAYTGDAITTHQIRLNGELQLENQLSQTTIGANGAASALTANPVGYVKIKINGTYYIIPVYNP